MTEKFLGNIHSIETCGTVDGPGVRFVVFVQGCPLRCQYCHNPDTWDLSENKKMSVAQILKKYEGVKEFCKGGLTITGGEPLLQIDFVTELFKQAKKQNIHTALDTSGITFNPENTDKIDRLMKYTDLVLLDIKHIDEEEHKKLTGHSNQRILEFAKYLSDNNKDMWIRHVVVPDLTYNEKYLRALGSQLRNYTNIKALDVLPYHDMAVSKYENLGYKYPLAGVRALTKDEALQARIWIVKGYRNID